MPATRCTCVRAYQARGVLRGLLVYLGVPPLMVLASDPACPAPTHVEEVPA
jgi:hypothetical protein